MKCEEYGQSLAALIEGDISAERRAQLEAHTASCDDCRALTADLERIRQAGSTLERHPVPRDGWSRISARLQADPAFRRAEANVGNVAGTRVPWSWLALAASLLLAVGAAVYMMPRVGTPAGQRASQTIDSNASRGELVESIEEELRLAAEHYERAINRLEQVANQSDTPLSPEMMADVRQNLAVIDKAIDESRQALRAQPENQLAQESLFDAFRRKVALLQDTIALMNEMRKGNQAGVARIVEGADKS
jgi:anti-sigma factor RsiW